MSNQIHISASDNEMYIIAYNWNGSYELAHVQSGNNNVVDLTITIEAGKYRKLGTFNGVNKPLSHKRNLKLPAGDYTLAAVCINWGGPMNCAYTFNGQIFTVPASSQEGIFPAPTTTLSVK